MAKKKRKRNRRPVAPPVHSSPETVYGPAGSPPSDAPPARPITPEPPPTAAAYPTAPAPVRPREAARRRTPSRRKRRRARPYIITAAVIVVIVGAILGQRVLSQRATNEFNALARANGCGELQTTSGSGSAQHLQRGQRTNYDTMPPTHGVHDGTGTVPAGIYTKPFSKDPLKQPSIYRAVHSLEHGAVIIWYDDVSRKDLRALERRYRNERKVIVVPYTELKLGDHVAMTAWGRLVGCKKLSTRVIDAFIDRFREARSAPEPRNGI